MAKSKFNGGKWCQVHVGVSPELYDRIEAVIGQGTRAHGAKAALLRACIEEGIAKRERKAERKRERRAIV